MSSTLQIHCVWGCSGIIPDFWKCCTAILQGPSLLVRQVCFTLSINILMSMSQALDDPTSSRLADSQTWKWLKHVPTHLLQNQLQENNKKTGVKRCPCSFGSLGSLPDFGSFWSRNQPSLRPGPCGQLWPLWRSSATSASGSGAFAGEPEGQSSLRWCKSKHA